MHFPAVLRQPSQNDVVNTDIAAAEIEETRSVHSGVTKMNDQIISLCLDPLDAEQISPRELVERPKYRMGPVSLLCNRSENRVR